MEIFNIFNTPSSCESVLFYFVGHMSQNVIGAMGEALRHKLEAQGTKGATTRKVFSTYVEMAQNILNYSADADRAQENEQYSQGCVAISHIGERFYIVCGNHIDRAHLERVRAKLETIRAMSPEEIKQAYKQQLRNDEHDDEDELSKGAGLGFLTVARDASEPIEFCFIEHELPAEKVGFYLKAVI